MTRDEKIVEIEHVCRLCQAFDQAFDSAHRVIGCDPDSPLWTSVFRLQSAIVKQTAKLIGDEGEWLDWFIFENDYGRKGLEAAIAPGVKMRKIRTPA